MARLGLLACLVAVALLAGRITPAGQPLSPRVVLVMIDGLRWQEVFRGASDALLTKERGNVESAAALLDRFGGASPAERRSRLMPFLWSVVAEAGSIYGHRDEGSKVECTNGRFVSYPGYSETICGIVDERIVDNSKIVNPNRNVFEVIAAREGGPHRVALFGCWDVFPYIFGAARNGLYVDDSLGPFAPPWGPSVTPAIELVNRLRVEVPRRWPGSHFDAMLMPVVREWVQAARPAALFIAFGETDEWAHEGDYGRYLEAAHRADAYIRELWELLQSMPEYRGRTTLVVTADHGRGSDEAGSREWNSHNARTKGSHEMWLAMLGPDVPAEGVRRGGPTVGQAQIAATVASVMGIDWSREQPGSAPPLQPSAVGPMEPTE